jgi:antitoxin CptB
MRELDQLLNGFLDRHYGALSAPEIGCFEAILDLPDPELYGYLLGRAVPADPAMQALLQRICDHGAYSA